MVVGKHVIRTSDRLAFKRCRRSWDFQSYQRQRWSPKYRPKPLDFGIAMHEAWATYYDPDTWHVPRELMLEPMQAVFLKVTSEQLKGYRELGFDMGVDIEEDFNERRELGLGIISHYVQWAPKVDAFKPVKVEYDFEVPIIDPDTGNQLECKCHGWLVYYQGRLDGLVQDEFGFYWILEHKTAGQLGDTSHLELDEQCGSYAWALSHYGVHVKGIIYNEALKDYPTPPTRLKNTREGRNYSVNKQQRTTYEIYLQELIKNGEDITQYEDMLDYLRHNGNPFFRRTQVHRNTYELQEIGQRIALEAMDMVDPGLRIYPNPGRFKCSFCSFRSPCIMMSEGSDYEFYLEEFYDKREIPDGAIEEVRGED